MSNDNISHVCSCRGPDGRQLGLECPKLRDRKHGRYVARYSVVGTDGKRRQPSVSAATKTEARKLRDDIVRRLDKGETVDRRMTVGDWLDLWVAGKARSVRANTLRSYQGHITQYLKPHLGSIPLEALRKGHVSAMIDKIVAENPARKAAKQKQVGPTTLHRIRATLRAAMNEAIEDGRLSANPAGVKLAPASKPKVHPWEPSETGRFLDHVAADPLGPLFEIMALTGLRRGEACGLRWVDVDLPNSVLTVRQQQVVIGNRVEFAKPKTASGEDRRVDLDGGTVGTLLALQMAQDTARGKWGTAWVDSGLVFVRADGTPWHPGRVTVRFKELAVEAGLRPIRLHDLRHGAASLALAAGVPLATVSKRLGHSTLSVTADLYTHLLTGVGAAAAEATANMVPRSRPATADLTESAVIVQPASQDAARLPV